MSNSSSIPFGPEVPPSIGSPVFGPANKTTVFLTTSDVSAAVVGAGFSSVYGMSTPPMQALAALIISVVARLTSESTFMNNNLSSMNESQKNQLIVGVLSGIFGYYKSPKTNVIKSILTGISQDLIGQELLRTFNFEDKFIIGGN
jgi:hypothetical protein